MSRSMAVAALVVAPIAAGAAYSAGVLPANVTTGWLTPSHLVADEQPLEPRPSWSELDLTPALATAPQQDPASVEATEAARGRGSDETAAPPDQETERSPSEVNDRETTRTASSASKSANLEVLLDALQDEATEGLE